MGPDEVWPRPHRSAAEGRRCWLQTLQRQLPPEQLAYVAALAAGSPLIFGDVPMARTLQRLLHEPSLAELDAGFATQVRSGSRAERPAACSAG